MRRPDAGRARRAEVLPARAEPIHLAPSHGARSPAASAIEVEVSDTQGYLAIDPGSVTGLVRRVLEGEGVDQASISVALVDDATIHAVNLRHLDHDWPTDVISFRLSETSEPVLVGELVVSVEMAVTTSRRAGTDPWAELALYMVHGLLHLCGYDDLAVSDVDAMRRREGEILAREGLTNTFPLVGLGEADDGERENTRWSD
jgi:probable rRNA maturation factor